MKRLLIIYLFLVPFFAHAQQQKHHVIFLTKDSLSHRLTKEWRFHSGDNKAWANAEYNDSNWHITDPLLIIQTNKKNEQDTFNSIGWFRLHINIDTSLSEKPLALSISHSGASEVFLDGEKVYSTGIINGADSSTYVDPYHIPFIIVMHGIKEHVLAIRYANYKAQKNYTLYNDPFAGFSIIIGEANNMIANNNDNDVINSFVFTLLFGIFITLSFLHLFLFLYYKAARSNLHFSIFCLALAAFFFIPYINIASHHPSVKLAATYVGLIASSLSISSFSGLINELFSRKKLRTRIISGICLITPLLWFVWNDVTNYIYIALIVVVPLEAIVLTIIAIYKKVKGAKIIGFGILFFTIFILCLVITAVALNGINLDGNTFTGQLILLLLAAAILSVPGSMSVYLAWSFARINKDLKSQLLQVEMLSEKNLQQEQEKKRILETQNEQLEKEVATRTAEIDKQHQELKAEKKKSDDLLNNILPEEIADELKQKGISSARFFDHVTVLFTDFVNFTKAGERMSPQELVDELHTCFKTFDDIISKYNIEKIKTIGDAYLAVCGLPVADNNNAVNVAKAAIEIRQFMLDRRQQLGDKTFEVRIGIHTGSVVAGIVGVKKFAYDIWGDTVNTAARMEQNSEPGKINCSQTTYELIKGQFTCTYRGEITAKNKGELSMYFVEKEN